MTNYLEELLDNANALLEQVQRLERSGTGPDWEDAALEGVTRRFAGREPGKETRRTLEEKRDKWSKSAFLLYDFGACLFFPGKRW